MEPIEINKRATFFLAEPMLLTADKMQKIAEFFSGVLDLMPAYDKRIQMNITPTGVVTSSEESGIEMKRTDGSLKVTFDSNRIDVFSIQGCTLYEFVEMVKEIKEVIHRLDAGTFARFALCHQLYYNCTEEQFKQCYHSTFCDAENESVEWNSQRVIREKFAEDSPLMLNNIIFLGRVLNAIVDGNIINEKLLLNIDVNTVPGSAISAVNESENKFFERAMQIIEADERVVNDIFTE